MTNVQKSEIKDALVKYLHEKGVSQNGISTSIGISNATLSHMLNDKWESIDDKMWRKVRNYVDKSIFEGLATTADHNSIIKLCDTSRKHKFMIGLTADTGMGKTTTLKAYSRKKETFYISYDKTLKPKQFFLLLLRTLGVSFEGNINAMVNRIAEELNDNLDNPLLIIDEAGKIDHTMILYLHVLRDKTNQNSGIVLAGMPYFQNNLIKFANKEKEGYAEFLRRINMWHSLKGLSKQEIINVLQQCEINDTEEQRQFLQKRKFGELMNEILLYQTLRISETVK